jgi:hypothetical protein
MMRVSTPLMLRSEAIARRKTGVLSNALWPRVSKHDPDGAAPFVHSGPPPSTSSGQAFEPRLRRSSGRGPREACMLCEPRSADQTG